MIHTDLTYLRPPKAAHDLVHTAYYIKHGEKTKGARKIYEMVDYDEFEMQKIHELEEEVKKNNLELPQDWKRSDFLKMQYAGKCKLKEAYKKLVQHVEWRNNPLYHQLTELNLEFLKEGIIYLHGRDKEFRPIIILNAYMISLKKHTKEIITESLSFFMESVKKFMMIPNKVENWIFMLETNQIGVFGLPLKGLGMIIDCMSTNFCGCLDKMYILNPSSGLNFAWRGIQSFIDPETQNKINFVTKKDMNKLLERIDVSQLEKKYGGTRENLTNFWPPINLDLETGYPEEKKVVELEIEQQIQKGSEDQKVENQNEKIEEKQLDMKNNQEDQLKNGQQIQKNQNDDNLDQKKVNEKDIEQNEIQQQQDQADQKSVQDQKIENDNSKVQDNVFNQNQGISKENEQDQGFQREEKQEFQNDNNVQAEQIQGQQQEQLQKLSSEQQSKLQGSQSFKPLDVTFGNKESRLESKRQMSNVSEPFALNCQSILDNNQKPCESNQQFEEIEVSKNQDVTKTPTEVILEKRQMIPEIEGEEKAIKAGCCACSKTGCLIF